MSTDSYVKSIRIKFEADDVSYKKIENDMNELSKLDLFSEDDAKAIANELKEFETLKNQISSIEDTLSMIADVDNDIANRTRDELEKELEKLKKQLKDKQSEKPEDAEDAGAKNNTKNNYASGGSYYAKEKRAYGDKRAKVQSKS